MFHTVARLSGFLGVLCLMSHASAWELSPHVVAEEVVYTYENANNGAGPLWCYGSTCLVKAGHDLFASGLETLPDQVPLNNVRWLLFKRTPEGWQQLQADPVDRQREPCPLVGFPDGRLFLSSNPTLTEPGTYNGPAEPRVLQFSALDPYAPPVVEVPPFEDPPVFTEHSYRGFAGDGPGRELVLFNIWMYDLYYWTFRDREGNWSKQGKLFFPPGTEYEEPHPVRLCYPEIYLRNRECHFLGISDIVEPVKAWREFKLEMNQGRTWDYDFRRLFYTWTPDITTTEFQPWVEIASREQTCGHISNLDLWVDDQHRAHLLWAETTVWHKPVRDRFFPDVPLQTSLEYAIVEGGQVVQRQQLMLGGEQARSEIASHGRFQVTPDGRLFVVYYVSGTDGQGQTVSENRIMEVRPDGTHSEGVRIALQKPFTSFMTATERGGSPPSYTLHMLGQRAGEGGTIAYASVRLRH